jgi:hypothetical protein
LFKNQTAFTVEIGSICYLAKHPTQDTWDTETVGNIWWKLQNAYKTGKIKNRNKTTTTTDQKKQTNGGEEIMIFSGSLVKRFSKKSVRLITWKTQYLRKIYYYTMDFDSEYSLKHIWVLYSRLMRWKTSWLFVFS